MSGGRPARGPAPRRSNAIRSTPVPGPGRERGQQQRRIHRRIQPRDAADPPGRGPPGIQDNQDPPVRVSGRQVRTITSPPAGRRPPVDRPNVVADDVLAQGIELSCPARAAASGAGRRAGAAERVSRPGACGLPNGGSNPARSRPRRGGPGRAARPSGPNERTITAGDTLSPRRSGVSVPSRRGLGRPAAAISAPWARLRVRASAARRRAAGPAAGRRPGFAHGHRDPRRSRPAVPALSPDRVTPSRRTLAASYQVGDDRGEQHRVDSHQGRARTGRPARLGRRAAPTAATRPVSAIRGSPRPRRLRGSNSMRIPGEKDHRGTGIPPGRVSPWGPGRRRGPPPAPRSARGALDLRFGPELDPVAAKSAGPAPFTSSGR